MIPIPLRAWLGAVLLFVLSASFPTGHSAETPVIRTPTLRITAEGTLTFQFEANEGESIQQIRLQTASELRSPSLWTNVAGALITEVIQGLYQVELPAVNRPSISFFRVVINRQSAAPLVINEVMSQNISHLAAADGSRWDWIEIYNPGDQAVDLAGFSLATDLGMQQKWLFPSRLVQPGGFLMVFASGLNSNQVNGELHADFKLNSDGEALLLLDPAQRVLDEVQLPPLQADQSIGRLPDGSETFHVYSKTQATPGLANLVVSLGSLIETPRFSTTQRFFAAGATLNLELQPGSTNHLIRFTTNGAPVTTASSTYTGALVLQRGVVVRARAYEGARSSAEAVASFFFGADHQLPIVSLATQPSNFEFTNGFLYGMTTRVVSSSGQVLQSFPFNASNAWLDREAEVSLEFFEPNRQLGFQQRAGLKIFGGWGSRGYPQKSMALFARQRYGEGKFKYRVFPDKDIDAFETLVLRNSGNDNQSTHQTPVRPPITAFGPTQTYGSYFVNSSFTLFRDAMMQRLLQEETTLDTQGYRPAVLYINGEYWGIYNLREKVNEDYVINNHGLRKGQADVIEGYGGVMAGDATVYNAMRSYIANRDMRAVTNFAFVEQTYVDIDNFIDYHLAVIYFQNFDIGNIKSWRPRVPRGRFRWMVYDQDYGFNLWKPEVYLPAMARDYADYNNMFRFYTASAGSGTGWPNEGGRTLLLRRLLLNEGFKQRFITRCADLLNSAFREEKVVQTIESMAAVIRPEISRHLDRWSWAELQRRGFGKPHQKEYQPFVQATWETNLLTLLDFARARPAKLRQDCLQHFGLTNGLATITLASEPLGSARFQLNSIKVSSAPWTGVVFKDFPVTVTAIPTPGYRLLSWAGAEAEPSLRLQLQSNTTFTARFERIEPAPSATNLILTEIQYHPASTNESGDWIELHNPGAEPVALGGLIFRDDEDDHDFLLPSASLPPGGYIVLCQDAHAFSRIYPNVTNYVGSFKFGLGNGGDVLRIYGSKGDLHWAVPFSDDAPWPAEADGTGRTLQLISPSAFSAHPSAWRVSPALGGSPGAAN